jgi:hypothetical protein
LALVWQMDLHPLDKKNEMAWKIALRETIDEGKPPNAIFYSSRSWLLSFRQTQTERIFWSSVFSHCCVASKHRQAEAEDAVEDAAGGGASADSPAADGTEPEPEPESDAVEQLAVALFDFPPEEADDLGCAFIVQQSPCNHKLVHFIP